MKKNKTKDIFMMPTPVEQIRFLQDKDGQDKLTYLFRNTWRSLCNTTNGKEYTLITNSILKKCINFSDYDIQCISAIEKHIIVDGFLKKFEMKYKINS